MHKLTQIAMSLLLILGMGATSFAQKPLGDWEGKLEVGAQSMRIIFHISEEEGVLAATMDSPDQGAYGIPVSEISFEAPKLNIKLDRLFINYTGKYDPEAKSISGTFVQGMGAVPLNLSYGTTKAERPQTPKAPFPYSVEEVKVENVVENFKLAGTLTTPEGKGPFPTVILITGSGPQDRDETIFEHKPFWVIADAFSRNGIAVLRMDDRGIGESEGDFKSATSKDFARDIQSGIEFLKTRSEVDQSKIGLVGHSEGGLIAPMVASIESSVSYIVMLAGPGLPGDEILITQQEAYLEKSGFEKELVAKNKELSRKIYQIILKTPDNDEALQKVNDQTSELLSSFTEEDKASLGIVGDNLESRTKPMTSPWMRYFLETDPKPFINEADIPILALFGGKDIQVLASPNLAALASLMESNPEFSSKVYPDMNHLFQKAETGLVTEYGQLTETFSEQVIKDMIGWIKEQ
ncbi:MAG: alpha/beta hydrolase [Bacteroidia bacterium]|nr:alpha/beta hydrolase [Bacteroidia bacterium]